MTQSSGNNQIHGNAVSGSHQLRRMSIRVVEPVDFHVGVHANRLKQPQSLREQQHWRYGQTYMQAAAVQRSVDSRHMRRCWQTLPALM